MHELEKLKSMLCEELEKYADKGEMTAGSLEVVDKLAHTIKNLNKIIEHYDGEYSGRYMPRYEESYARKRDSMGRYSRRYSRDGIADKLRELMDDAPDDRTRSEIRKLADKMENM